MDRSELDARIAALEARRREMTIQEFIEDVESRHFRTNSDTGANSNTLFVWNMLRNYAGLPKLTPDDLRQRQIDSTPGTDLTLEDLRGFDELRGKVDFY